MRKTVCLLFLILNLCAGARAQAPTPSFSADVTAGCSPLVVTFKDASGGQPSSWEWNFGNGATSALQNPSTTFFTPGTYSVSLTVKNADGSNITTRTEYITVYGNPTVQFSASDSLGCYPFPVTFTDQSEASPGTTNTSWVWDLGDGTQSEQHNSKVTYQNSGTYTISLKVTNDKGCWNTATKQRYIQINGGVSVNFSYKSPITCHTPFAVSFTNQSSGPGALTYNWNFGDGTNSADATPQHTYTEPGVYSVTLVTESSNGCRDSVTKINLLNLGNTSTSFSVPDSVCVNSAVRFTNTSSANASTVLWNFGDGTTSTAVSPLKTFAATGSYTVQLQQTFGICADSATKKIEVVSKPTAAFATDKQNTCQLPLTVNFQNHSTGTSQYFWDFGDGTTSTDVNPAHTYTTYGSFNVTLIATNNGGCTDTLRMPGAVTISKPAIRFTSFPQKGCLPYTATCAAKIDSPDPVVSYLWDFGNGTTSTAAAPSVTYTSQGSYTVSLTITTAAGCTETYAVPAAVTVGNKPTVSFGAEPNTVCAAQPVQFTNQSSGATKYTWEFGDGGTGSEAAPSYQYNDVGTFSVKLVAENNGCKDSLTRTDFVTIKPPIASFSYKTTCTNKLFYTFRDQSVGATTWHWDFGDGTSSNTASPTHTFPGFGTFTVKLTVTNDTCEHTTQKQISIYNSSPNFSISSPVACHGTSIQFSADTTNAANIVSYSWNLGDGRNHPSAGTVSTVYQEPGVYAVSLTVKDRNGCTSSSAQSQSIQINGPTAALTSVNNKGCKGLQATFTDASKEDGHNRILSWQWDLGDGTLVNNTSPAPVQHNYIKGGNFDVSLVVRDAGGCADTTLRPALVNVSNISADFVSADTLSCPGAAVHFTNKSAALTAFKSEWTFGDGHTSTQQSPTAAYNTDGLYSVQLKITDTYGCFDSVTKTDYIAVRHPVASYTVSDSASSCIPLKVQFTNTSQHYNQQIWELNGGTSKLANPVQYYNTPGVYKTKLTIKSPGGCTDTATKLITVYDASESKISYLPLDGCKPLTVKLNAYSPQKMTYVWDFGDGTIVSNEDLSYTHVYQSFGDFVPKVIMKDLQGCIVPVTGKDTIHIKGATAKFGTDHTFFCDSGMVHFSDSTTFNNRITGYTWSFGDGTSSTEHSPSHYYARPGVYDVALMVLTENKCVDTFRLQYPVKVAASPAIRIIGDSIICVGEGIVHMGIFERADTALVHWAWAFPNGKTATIQRPPLQRYYEAGRQRIQAIAVNSSGCVDTAYQTIVVNPIPSVTLPSTITTMVGTPVLIPAVYSDTMRSYRWEAPEGLNCATCPRPVASPKLNTKYQVRFEDFNGCQNSGEVQVIVLCNNDNVFVPNTFSPNGDGSNDVFYVRGKGLSRVKTLRIFNRWGQVVFERNNFSVNDASAGWDGKFKGAAPVPGVYVYQVEIFCDNSQVVKFEGNVALIQ